MESENTLLSGKLWLDLEEQDVYSKRTESVLVICILWEPPNRGTLFGTTHVKDSFHGDDEIEEKPVCALIDSERWRRC